MGAFAEFERALIRERQREGIALAKQRGVYRGRKKSLYPEQVHNYADVQMQVKRNRSWLVSTASVVKRLDGPVKR